MAKSTDQRIAEMRFGAVYPHYVSKVEKKGRTVEDLHHVIEWLTGYDDADIERQAQDRSTFEDFFQNAQINPAAEQIKGVICGHRVEEIENQLTQQVRWLDKLVDELARGKKMESILRG